MKPVVRSIDVGYGNTKYVSGFDGDTIRCAHFASMAPNTERHGNVDVFGGKRKTIGLEIEGLVYEVGPEVHLAADIFQAKQMHDNYCATSEYLALLRGALHYMKQDKIDLLVLGLPVATIKAKRSFLEKRMTGLHPLSRNQSVQVNWVKVVPQPLGALMHYGFSNNCLTEVSRARNLVIDPGARTFDWLVSDGMKVMYKRSHSVNRGMIDVLSVIADGISKAENTQYRDYDRIDSALRNHKKPKVFGKEYDISKHMPAARKITEEAVFEMLRFVGDGSDLDNIILVGGGAFFFKQAIKEAFPKHRVHEMGDALFANVKGFQIAGMQYAKDAITPGVDGDHALTTAAES